MLAPENQAIMPITAIRPPMFICGRTDSNVAPPTVSK